MKNSFFLNNLGLLFSAKENVLNNFEIILFPIKNLDKIRTFKPTPDLLKKLTKHKKSKLKLQQDFMNWIIANEKDMNN